ncbi:hypothetical protein [Clostridium gasigenes]|uniref:hypothetical protein n=1 Tax=Clostridium gasigenes TaxID=94869 RepID=UPI001C0C0578|nr:hypothetical protein [Clostridium gasigenes]MBU3104319.1 hypothetical protein [Clostridium gasigenes]
MRARFYNPVVYYDPSGYMCSPNKDRQLALPEEKIQLGLPAPGESSFNIGERLVSKQVYENYIKGQESFRLGAPNADSFFFNKPGANTATRSFDAAVNAGFTPQNIVDTVKWGDNELLRIRFKLDKLDNIVVPGVSKIPGGIGDGIIPGTNELFTGQGCTKNYLGERGFDEYIGSNVRLIQEDIVDVQSLGRIKK